MIFELDDAQQLTAAQYRDYLSWVHIMLDVERQRLARRSGKQPTLAEIELQEEALDSGAAA